MPPTTRRSKQSAKSAKPQQITVTINLDEMYDDEFSEESSPLPKKIIKSKPKQIKSKKIPTFNGPLTSLLDLIRLSEERILYSNIDVPKLIAIHDEMVELQTMIGLDDIKRTIFEQLVFYLQNMHLGSEMYLNTVIYGPPGTGKTTVAKLLGKMFSKLKVITLPENYEYEDNEEEEGIFEVARRDDLVGEYLGSTAVKTQEFLSMCIGGVVFIDEVYSLGNKDGGDSFSKEAIDTINLFLSENRNHFMMIVAGYKEEINQCFFKLNEGLRRRFMWYHTIEPYSPEQLRDIFLSKLGQSGWKCTEDVPQIMLTEISSNPQLFVDNAGSIENFITLLKIKHSNRVVLLDEKFKKIITCEDIKTTIKSSQPVVKNESFMSMYM
jgi:SpoVK/Ycf46/Vps4 family AAA+-type ATPase